MKRFPQKAKVIVFLLVLSMLLPSLTAFSEHAQWDCPEPGCGRNGNRGNYCGNCGHPAPWMEEDGTSGGRKTTVSVGEYITYGHYEQDNDMSNGKEAIEWLVLDYDANTNSALLISRYGLDARKYHNSWPFPTWGKSDIRNWLKGTFLNTAFTAAEQAGIVTTTVSTPSYYSYSGGEDTEDRIWLLSSEEAEEYFSSTISRRAVPTTYAVAQGTLQDSRIMLNGEGCCWWWLRSPGNSSYNASGVNYVGSLDNIDVINASNAVRPALWLDLDLAIF